MHAGQDRVLGDGSWTRGPCPKSTKVARNKQAGVHGFELPLERPARQVIAVQHSSSRPSHHVRGSPQRAPAPRHVDDARPPISLQGSAHESRPGLFSIPGPSRGPSSTGGSTNVSRRWGQQGPSEGPASPLRPSRLEARLSLRLLSRITNVQLGSASLSGFPTSELTSRHEHSF